MRTASVQLRTYISDILDENQLRASRLAKEIGVSHATVGRWLKGEDTPSPESCRKLSQFTHTPIEEVLRIAGHIISPSNN
jgi:transcriptional regulator with XRE-family HTH domain